MEAVLNQSSVSYINTHRNWELFCDYFEVLEHLKLKGMPGRNALRNIKRKIFLMDASVRNISNGLRSGNRVHLGMAAVSSYTAILDDDGLLPVFCHVD